MLYRQIHALYGCSTSSKETWASVPMPTFFSVRVLTWYIYRYIAAIKFDSRNKTPYSGVLRALSQILQQILSESENDIRLFYDNLKAHLGAQFCNIKLLAEFIPELNTLVFDPIHDNNSNNEAAAPSDAYSMDNDETQARFHNLFIETLRAITHWKMITLVRISSHISLTACLPSFSACIVL